MAPLQLPLTNVKFSLNAWGVAGIFGGDENISAMAFIPLYQGRRWLGWYNSPGSLDVARHFARLAQSHFWQRIFPHTTTSPAILLGFDGKVGPEYTAAETGTKVQTGHLGHLVMVRCREIAEEIGIPGREETPAHVALIDLDSVTVDYDHDIPRLSRINAILAFVPISVSIAACVMCTLVYDWYSFSVILVGILAGGVASIVMGSGKLTLKPVTKPALGSLPGDGILVPMILDDIVVVVKGAKTAVSVITNGKFSFELSGRFAQPAIAISSLILILQFLAQLLLIPQGKFFGQLMFVSSLSVSWLYTFCISFFRREPRQASILFQKLGDPQIRKFHLGARTTMTVFATLLAFHKASNPSPIAVQKMLSILLPNDTVVWDKWRRKVARQVCDPSLSCLVLGEDGDDKALTDSEKALLATLLDDASAAYEGYLQWVATPPSGDPSPGRYH